jgi:hypothetical protein
MNVTSIRNESISSATNSAGANAVNRLQSIVDRVVYASYVPDRGKQMARISDNSDALRSASIKMVATDDSGASFEVHSGRDMVETNVLTINDIVSMSGGGDGQALKVYGPTHMAKSLKAMLHIHQVMPQLEPLSIMKAVISDLSLADQPNDRVLQVLELSGANVSADNDKESVEPIIDENANSIKFRR